jgi:hypothetical protein
MLVASILATSIATTDQYLAIVLLAIAVAYIGTRAFRWR